ncbi:MAG: RHS repeat-associated core domain-containing protein, partial [Longimicrobiales bacterium]
MKRKNVNNYDLILTQTLNAQHKPLTVTDAAGKTTTATYNTQGQVTSVTTPKASGQENGATTSFSYNANGYLVSISGPVSGATTTFTYDSYGRRKTVTDPSEFTFTFDYDALDRITQVTYPDDTYQQTIYERLDPQRQRDRLGRWTERFYDPIGRRVSVRDPSGDARSYEWCSCGSLESFADANGNVTTFEYDLQGRRTKETRGTTGQTTFTYEDTTSRLKSLTDRKGNTTTFSYYTDDRISSRSFSDGTATITYTYGAVTGLLSEAANGADTIAWTYDVTDRIVSETSAANESTVSYTYDDAGSVTSLKVDGEVFVTFSYDEAYRLTRVTRNASIFDFGYDSASRKTSLGFPNGVATTYEYDTQSRLTSVSADSNESVITDFSYSYDAVDNRVQKVTPDWTETYAYDAASRLRTVARDEGSPSRWKYFYDGVGNRTGEQIDDAPSVASYDNLNQLVSVQAGGALLFQGMLDESATVTVQGKVGTVESDGTFTGEATVGTGTSNVIVTATDPTANTRTNTYEVTVSGPTATYGYDENGNLISREDSSGSWEYEWDGRNLLTRVLKDELEVVSFAYDPLGRRVQKVSGGVTTKYLLESHNVLREARSDGTVFKYIHPRSLDEPLAKEGPSGTLYYHLEGLDSVVKLTNEAGSAVHEYVYDAWGQIEEGSSQGGYAFTGREWEPEIQAYYFRARYYDPKSGRFLSEDPVRTKGSLYVYVRNNPPNRIDPMGLLEVDVKCKNCDSDKAGRIQGGINDVCLAVQNKPQCSSVLLKWGLLPCYWDMCWYNDPPVFKCGGRGSSCGGFGGGNDIILYDAAFAGPCGDASLPSTIAHEMSHVCISGRGDAPGPDCDIRARTRFGVRFCDDESIAIT